MGNDTRRKYPRKDVIRAHWAERLVEIGKFDSPEEVVEEDYCFGCGMLYLGRPSTHIELNWLGGNTQRCHITPRVEGGTDGVENIHLLCHTCHRDSEYLTGDYYWEWLKNRSVNDVMAACISKYRCCPSKYAESLRQKLGLADFACIEGWLKRATTPL